MGYGHLGLEQLKERMDAGEVTFHCFTNDLGWFKRNSYILEGSPGQSYGTYVTREVWEYAIKAGCSIRSCQTSVEKEVEYCLNILIHADVTDEVIDVMIADLQQKRKERRQRIEKIYG